MTASGPPGAASSRSKSSRPGRDRDRERAAAARGAQPGRADDGAVSRVSSATVSTLDLDELLEGTHNEIVAYMGVPSFLYIATYDAPHDTVRFEMFKREGRNHAPHHKSNIRRNGLTGWIIEHGEVLHVRDMSQGAPPVEPIFLGEPVRS